MSQESENILYVENSGVPYVWTESETIKNIAKMFGSGDIIRYLGEGVICCYRDEDEWEPFLDVLIRSGIEYKVIYKDYTFFENMGVE